MNDMHSDHEPMAGEALMFDRLVDGALSEAERRQLLLTLDARPEGWRRCALAFLEAQSWGRELRGLVNQRADASQAVTAQADTAHGNTARPVQLVASHANRWPISGSTLWAMAASFLLAFGVVMYVRGNLQLAGSTPTVTPLATHRTDAQPSAVPTVANGQASPGQQTSHATRLVGSPAASTITVAIPNQQGTLQTVQLPLVEVGSMDDVLRAGQDSSGLPAQVVEALRRMGHQVEQQRQLVPIDFQDGRRAFVPVDQVRVHYVGDQGFQ